MVYVRRIETNSGVVFCLRRMDKTAIDSRYFKCIGEAKKHAKRLGLEIIN